MTKYSYRNLGYKRYAKKIFDKLNIEVTEMNAWSINPTEFTASIIDENIKKHVFLVPNYQRGIAWKKTQQEEFIDSLKKGWPFGTILLYKRADGNYEIIDGYQRCTTIYSFVQSPSKYFNESDIADNLPAKIIQITGYPETEDLKSKIKEHIENWMHNLSAEDIKNIQYLKYAMDFVKDFPLADGKLEPIAEAVRDSFKQYKEMCDKISTMAIPAIIITGDDDALPEIFERINSRGTKLTKYQIYAATWTKKYKINPQKYSDLFVYNKKRYNKMQTTGLQIADYSDLDYANDNKLELFEICYALGKKLGDAYPGLFDTSKDAVDVDGLGFTLINSCLGQKNSNSKNLPNTIDKYVGKDKINDFIKCIEDCVKLADNFVGKFNAFKLNSKDLAGPLHAEYQIISIIANIFINRHVDYKRDANTDIITEYNIQFDKPKKGFDIYKRKLEKNLRRHYCLDIINKKWAGSGDKKMDGVIFANDYYTSDVSWKDFSSSLKKWFEEKSSEISEYSRVYPPQEQEKLFLSMLYLPRFSAGQALDSSKYDVEHLATKNLMKKCLDRYSLPEQLRLPISSIANLCLLPMEQNRSKKDKTIYEDDKYLNNAGMSLSDIEAKYTFTTREDLSWLNDEGLSREEFRSNYFKYLNNRFARLLDVIEKSYDQL